MEKPKPLRSTDTRPISCQLSTGAHLPLSKPSIAPVPLQFVIKPLPALPERGIFD
ncbi:MAG: hypothetical protein J7642_23175 [Cyanobacteria bacterium SBC]|nr:hypothetical protein [Cyanobacteria bacterium SBC]